MNKSVGEYTLVELLGKGSYAEVFKAIKHGETTEYAIKIIPRHKLTPKLQENLGAEIAIMRDFHHPNIVRLFEILKTENNIYLVLEYCAGGDLHKYIRQRTRLSESVAQGFMRQLAQGLRFLASKNLIHRDIKPQNLLLTHNGDDATIKIADFGFARHLATADLAQTLCGTPLYMAPEIMQYKQYDAKADLWSVGAVLYEMITGRPPFTGENQAELFRNIQTKALRIPRDLAVSPDVVEVLQQLLERNPLRRASLETLCRLPFVNLPVDESKDDSGAEEMKMGTSPVPTSSMELPTSSSIRRSSASLESTAEAKVTSTETIDTAVKTSPTHVRTTSSVRDGAAVAHMRTPSKTPSAITTMMMAAAAANSSGSGGSPLPVTSTPQSPPQHQPYVQTQPTQSSPPDNHLAMSLNGSTHAPSKGIPAPRINPFKAPDAAPGGSALRSSNSHSGQPTPTTHAVLSDSMAQTHEWAPDAHQQNRTKLPEEVNKSTGSDDFVMVEPSSHAWKTTYCAESDAHRGEESVQLSPEEVAHLQEIVHRAEYLANLAVAITAASDRLIRGALSRSHQEGIEVPVQSALSLYLHAMYLLKESITQVKAQKAAITSTALNQLLVELRQRFDGVFIRAEQCRARIAADGSSNASPTNPPEVIIYQLALSHAQDAATEHLLGNMTAAADNFETAKLLMEAVLVSTTDASDRRAISNFIKMFGDHIVACHAPRIDIVLNSNAHAKALKLANDHLSQQRTPQYVPTSPQPI